MTEARPQPAMKPTPSMAGNGSSPVKQSISSMAEASAGATSVLQALFAPNQAGTLGGKGFQDLMQAYQTLARRNSEKLTESIKALTAVKTPQEFVELQQKFMTESIAAAVEDGKTIGELTKAAFTAAFEPMRKKIGDLQTDTR